MILKIQIIRTVTFIQFLFLFLGVGFQQILDAGSVIPDLIRDRHDKFGIFCETNKGF